MYTSEEIRRSDRSYTARSLFEKSIKLSVNEFIYLFYMMRPAVRRKRAPVRGQHAGTEQGCHAGIYSSEDTEGIFHPKVIWSIITGIPIYI